MPSPDATPYVDLRLFDLDAQDVFETALVNLQSYLPEWEAREGHTEVMLMESLALEVAEAIFAINRLPGTVTEVLLRLYGVERAAGTPPEVDLLFTTSDAVGHLIPPGVRVALPLSSTDEPLVFTTTLPLEIPSGSTSGVVHAVADRNTAAANGTQPGVSVDLIDAVMSVERVELASEVVFGSEEEDDESWFTRGAQRLGRLAETLVLPRHFVAAALERTEVVRAQAVDNYDPNTAELTDPGHMTVVVYGAGAPLSADAKEIIRAEFDLQAQANLAVHVIDPTITVVDVTATLVALPGWTTEQITTAATDALAEWLSPELWPWTGTVYRNELIALLSNVEGVDRVDTVDAPAADLPLAGVAPLADLGVVTLTVVVP